MTLKECYRKIDGDYEGTIKRLYSEKFVEKIVRKFLQDKSFPELEKAMEEEQREEAFRAAHTLKGVSQNLGFTRLHARSAELTELLRESLEPEAVQVFEDTKREYQRTIEVIADLQEGIPG